MSIAVYAHIAETTEISVTILESEVGKYCAFTAGDLAVLINSREKMIEIASLLENAAQKWDEEEQQND